MRPARSFAANPAAYDPHYHFKLAIDAGLNAYAAPLGMIEAGADTFAGAIPLILKVNSNNSVAPKDAAPDQAVTATAQDALRLGCSAIGFTIYPGGHQTYDQMEEIREMSAEAKALGMAVVIFAKLRGAQVTVLDGRADRLAVCATALNADHAVSLDTTEAATDAKRLGFDGVELEGQAGKAFIPARAEFLAKRFVARIGVAGKMKHPM